MRSVSGTGSAPGSSPPGRGPGSSPSAGLPGTPLSPTSPLRDGSTPQRAMFSPGVLRNPDEEFTYFVHHYGRWVLANAQEARSYHSMGFRVYNNPDMNEVTEWVNPVAVPDTTEAFRDQNEEADQVLEALEDEADADRYTDKKKKGTGSKPSTPTKQEPRSPPGSGGSGNQGPDAGAGAGSRIAAA